MTETLREKEARLWAIVSQTTPYEAAAVLSFMCGYMEHDAKFFEGIENALRINCPERLQP